MNSPSKDEVCHRQCWHGQSGKPHFQGEIRRPVSVGIAQQFAGCHDIAQLACHIGKGPAADEIESLVASRQGVRINQAEVNDILSAPEVGDAVALARRKANFCALAENECVRTRTAGEQVG